MRTSGLFRGPVGNSPELGGPRTRCASAATIPTRKCSPMSVSKPKAERPTTSGAITAWLRPYNPQFSRRRFNHTASVPHGVTQPEQNLQDGQDCCQIDLL